MMFTDLFPAGAGDPQSGEARARSAARIEADVRFLADDLLKGREAGTRGFDLAALYVATQYRLVGLVTFPARPRWQRARDSNAWRATTSSVASPGATRNFPVSTSPSWLTSTISVSAPPSMVT